MLWDVVRISRSWRKRATVLLLALLILAALFLGWTSYNYTSEMRKTIEEENARTAVLWASMTEARFGTLYEHIYELLISLYNNTELRFDTPIMSARARIRIVDMMTEKLLVNDDADAFFVFDTENDYFLFSAKNGLSGAEVLDIKTYARENALTLSGSFGNRDWSVHSIGAADYFIKCVRLGKYAVGTISNVRYYAVDQMFNLLGEDTGCALDVGWFELVDDAVALRVEDRADRKGSDLVFDFGREKMQPGVIREQVAPLAAEHPRRVTFGKAPDGIAHGIVFIELFGIVGVREAEDRVQFVEILHVLEDGTCVHLFEFPALAKAEELGGFGIIGREQERPLGTQLPQGSLVVREYQHFTVGIATKDLLAHD